MAARDPRDFIADLVVEPDDEEVREAGPHSRDKLGILRYYLPAFARVCRAYFDDGPYFVDACAGPGVYSFRDSSTLLRGSSLIALGTGRDLPNVREGQHDVPVEKVLAVEKDRTLSRALRRRFKRYGDAGVAIQGDCNVDLLPLMEHELPRHRPVMAFLDPEAFEVEWATVQKVAHFRGDRLTEVLILVNPTAVLRVLQAPPADRSKLLWAFPPGSRSELEEIAFERFYAGEIDAREAKDRVVEAYVGGLRSLGYPDPVFRDITNPGRAPTRPGGHVYTLVFGSAVKPGNNIMTDAFDHMYTNQPEPPPPPSEWQTMLWGDEEPPAPRLPGARRPRR